MRKKYKFLLRCEVTSWIHACLLPSLINQHLLFLFDLSAKQLLWQCRSCNSCLAGAVRAKGNLAVWCCVRTSAGRASSPVWAARDWHSLAMANQGFLHTPMECSSFLTLFKNGTRMHREGGMCRNANNKRIICLRLRHDRVFHDSQFCFPMVRGRENKITHI